MKKNLTLLLILFISNMFSQTYTVDPTNYNTNGGGTWGSILKIRCFPQSDGTALFTVRRTDGTAFSSSGTIYLKVGGYNSYNTTRTSVSVNAGDYTLSINTDFTPYSNYPKEFYARYEPSNVSGYAWTGPITVYGPPSVSINNVSSANQVGQTMNISWSSTNQHHYGLYLYEGNTQIGTVSFLPVSGAHSYSWHIQSPFNGHILNGSNYKLKLVVWNTGITGNEQHVHDFSNVFSITNQQTNHPPNAPVIYSHSGNIYVNQSINLSIKSGSDPDGDQTKIQVTGTNSNLTDSSPFISGWSSNSVTYSVPITFNQTGQQTVYAVTYDEHGSASSVQQRVFNVLSQTSNSPPNPATFSNLPITTNINQPINISIHSGTDPDNDQVKVKLWATGSNHSNEANAIFSNFGNDGSYFSLNLTFSQQGYQTLYVKTVDDNGNESSVTTASINVVDNSTVTSVVIGGITFTADAINETSNNVFSLSGNVTANNILKFSGTVTVDKNAFSLSGNGRVYLQNIPNVSGDVDLYNGSFEYSVDGALSQLHATAINDLNEMFKLANLSVHIDDITLLSDGINIAGEIEFPELFGYVRANVSQIQVTQSNGIDLVGRINLNHVVTPWFDLNSLYFDFDMIQDKFSGGGTLHTTLFDAGVDISIIPAGIDSINFVFDLSNPYPLGTTGLSISGLTGGLDNIQNPPIKINVGCSLTPTLQGPVNIIELSNAQIEYILGNSFSGRADFKILGQNAANASIKIEDGKFIVNTSINFYDVVTADTKFAVIKRPNSSQGSSSIDVYAQFNAAIKIPASNGFPQPWMKSQGAHFPIVLASFENSLYNLELTGRGNFLSYPYSYKITYDGNSVQTDHAWNYSLFNNIVFPGSSVAQRIPLQFLTPSRRYTDRNSPNYNRFEGRSLIISPQRYQRFRNPQTNTLTQDFILTGTTNTLVVRAMPQSGTSIPSFSLTAPNGDVYDASTVSNYSDVVLSQNSSNSASYFTIKNPQAGAWLINLQNNNTTYLVDVIGTKREPGIILNDIQQNGNTVHITWTDDNPDYNGQISLFYSRDNDQLDGNVIVTGISEDDDTNDAYNFDISNLTPGTYYVYALMYDQNGMAVPSYSSNTFTVTSNIQAPANLSYTINNDDSVTFTWDALQGNYHYLLYYETNGNVSYTSLNYNAGTGNQFTIHDFDPQNNYQVMVVAIDANGVIGNASNTVDIEFTKIQTIDLVQGWNLVGFTVTPNNTDITQIFAPIAANMVQINNQTQVYNPSLPPYLNTLNSLENGQGYYINMNQAAVLNITGYPIDVQNLQISLHQGWNLITYPGNAPIDVQTALQDITAYVIQINDQTQVYNPNLPPYLNTLSQLIPGKGYWIKVSQNCTLTF